MILHHFIQSPAVNSALWRRYFDYSNFNFTRFSLILGPKPAFVQFSVKCTLLALRISHEKSSQSCRCPSLTIGNHVGKLLTHFYGRQSHRDRLESRFTFKNQHFWSKISFCTVWDLSRVGPVPPSPGESKIPSRAKFHLDSKTTICVGLPKKN